MGDREANDADGECPLRRKDADLMEMVTHNILFCRQCREEMIREKMKGSELNFQERTLPQKKEETVESNDQGTIFIKTFLVSINNKIIRWVSMQDMIPIHQ